MDNFDTARRPPPLLRHISLPDDRGNRSHKLLTAPGLVNIFKDSGDFCLRPANINVVIERQLAQFVGGGCNNCGSLAQVPGGNRGKSDCAARYKAALRQQIFGDMADRYKIWI